MQSTIEKIKAKRGKHPLNEFFKKRKVAHSDLAKYLGISVCTVRNCLNNHYDFKPEVEEQLYQLKEEILAEEAGW